METGCDLSNRYLGRFEQGSNCLYFFRCELWRATTGTAAGASCGKTGHRPLPDQVALELGECREHMEDKAASWRDGFDLFGKRLEVDLAVLQVSDEADEIGEVPA